MQASAPLDEDLEGLTGYGRWRRSQETSRRSFTARLIAEAVGGVCLLALLCWVIALSVQLRSLQNSNVRIAPECLHALGGGPVGSGGSLHPVMPEHCTAQLRAYAQGPYWDEVQLAAAAAMQQFGFADSVAAGSSNGASSIDGSRFISSVFSKLPSAILQRVARSLLVAAGTAPEGPGSSLSSSSSSGGSGRLGGPTHRQIAGHLLGQRASAQLLHTTGTADATAAAAAEGMAAARQQQLQQQQQGSVRPLVVFDIDETLLSNMPQILDPQAWPWEKWVAEAQAKALQPMLRLYTALCSHGYAIALVTGRHEDSRNSTMLNLQRAGYGQPCGSSSRGEAACCYAALLMRPANDSRLASVYKPWARAQLLAGGGYRLAALLGDQFSDINGLGVEAGSGVAAFKLPNPFYFIL